MSIDIPWIGAWLLAGLAVTALCAALMRLLPAMSASARSVVWTALLAAVPALAVVLALDLPRALAIGVELTPATTATMAGVGPAPTRADATTLVAIGWACAAAVGLSRLAIGLLTLRRWRTRCRVLPASAFDHLPAWCAVRNLGRRAVVAWSSDAPTPCVLGLWRPVIALPRAAAALPPATLDAILVHECAHVRRRDDVAQFAQHVVRALCAIHPAIWWIDRQLTLEREAACDDWVVALAAPPRAYARCLVALAEGRTMHPASLHVSFGGGRSQLAERVRRLVDGRRRRRLTAGGGTTAALSSGVAAASLAVLAGVAPPTVIATPEPAPVARAAVRTPWLPIVADQAAVPRADARSVTAAPPAVLRRPAAPGRPDRVERARRPVGGAADDVPAVADEPLQAAWPGGSLMVAAPAPAVAVPAALPHAEPPARLGWTMADAMTIDTEPAPTPDTGPSNLATVATPFRDAGLAVGDAGGAVGRAAGHAGQGLARGGVATGGFFARLGARVARAF